MEKNLNGILCPTLPFQWGPKETKVYKGLLLIENQTKTLALSEYMNSSNYGNHWKKSQLLSPWGMQIITPNRCIQLAR